MIRLGFDIEADGLLPTITKIHCIAIVDLDTGEIEGYGPEAIEKALDRLYEADLIVGHNIIDYDLRALRKVCKWGPRPGAKIRDTLVIARVIHSDLKSTDGDLVKAGKLTGKLWGSHSLEAWGHRLGEYKGSFDGPWDHWSEEMHAYCIQDAHVTYKLWQYLNPDEYSQVSLDLEHEVHSICLSMEDEGWPFDTKGAQALYTKLMEEQHKLEKALVEKFGQWQEVDRVLVPKRDNATLGYVKGVPVTKYKTVVFNPGSRVHIEKKLRELGWKPEVFTDGGRAKLDESVLAKLHIPEAADIVQYLLIQKRLGQLADGDNGWLRVLGPDGRIHGRYNTGGTVTGRAAHYSPNLGQVPAGSSPYGPDCRALFTVPDGWHLVGADMSGLELRCLAHYLAAFDKGEYAKIVCEGDVHTYHQEAAGLKDRNTAKTFIYAWLYGAGPAKIAKIASCSTKDAQDLIQRFMDRIPAIRQLKGAINSALKKGYLIGLDGRKLQIRSEHAALNTLLQSAGAILCKTWLRDFYNWMDEGDFVHGWSGDYSIAGWIHDELQVGCPEKASEYVGYHLVDAAINAGKHYNFRCPLTSSYSIGKTWRDTH